MGRPKGEWGMTWEEMLIGGAVLGAMVFLWREFVYPHLVKMLKNSL